MGGFQFQLYLLSIAIKSSLAVIQLKRSLISNRFSFTLLPFGPVFTGPFFYNKKEMMCDMKLMEIDTPLLFIIV